MKGQQKKLKQQLKKYKDSCKKAKKEKKRLKLEIEKLEKTLKSLNKDYDSAKAAKKKYCKAYKTGKAKLEKLKVNTNATPKKASKPVRKPAVAKKTTIVNNKTATKAKVSPTKVVAKAKPAAKKRPARKAPVKAKASTKPRTRGGTTTASKKPDNLKLIEGVGPKIEQLLHKAGIKTFGALGRASLKKLKEVLMAAGPRFRMHNPGTWAQQAKIAASGNMAQLKKLQAKLKGGLKK